MDTNDSDTERVWLVDRSFSDDEQNIIILIYATRSGQKYFRKERALTSFAPDHSTPVSVCVDPADLGPVTDDALQNRYATEVERMRDSHDPDETI